MRNYSRQIPNTYYKFQSPARNYTQEKRLQELHTLKQSEVKVGIYKYSTEDELGKGYSSKVYKGVEIEKIHKRYAIKVIELKKFRGSNLEMLEAEIEIHKNLIHQNVLRLHEVIKTPYFYYLILEYCPHGNLHEYIKQKKKLSESNALEIMEQVLTGFKYLLEEGVIHRDLKPANILRIGNKWKISDLGFAVKSKYGFKDRINVGTPLYMPPQSLKKSYYSSKSDIFALGVILYEMIQGNTPWESSNQKQLLEKIKIEIIIPGHIKSQAIRDFISKTCQLNENKRMSKQEIVEYQIRPAAANEPHSTRISQRQSAIAYSSNSSRLISRKPSIVIDIQPASKAAEDYIKHNSDLLANEFSLVKHIYSCLKNIDCFLIQPENRQIFTLTLFKLVLRLIRFLCDKKSNCYNLKNWLEYITTKEYNSLYQEMIEHSELLEKEYLEHIKHNDIKTIRGVNRKFPDLCHSLPISEKFFETLKCYLTVIIREHNHELMQLYIVSEETKEKIESKTSKEQVQGQISTQIEKSQELQIQKLPEQVLQKMSMQVSQKSDKQEADKFQKNVQLSGPRKIYESKRGTKRISTIQIGENFEALSPSEMLQQDVQENKQIAASSIEQIESKSEIKEQSELIFERKEQPLLLSNRTSKKVASVNIKSAASFANPTSFNDKIQALESLYTIYRTAQQRCQSEEKNLGEKLKVIVNYSQSKLDKRDYGDLRRLLRSI